MSLNKYEQALFDYLGSHPEERRHWQDKVTSLTRAVADPGLCSRKLERELWDYFVERSAHVPAIRSLHGAAGPRISLLNLSEYIIRLWGPPPTPKKKAPPPGLDLER